MDEQQLSHDDLLDVLEMTNSLVASISEVLKDNECNLALGALMSATITTILNQCNTLNEVIVYRNLFMQHFDNAIAAIQITGREKPPSI